jgi:hypothetical protein
MYCKDCKYWGHTQMWLAPEWKTARTCLNKHLKAASYHPAGPNYEGPITTDPDFGCIQGEP